MTLHYDYSSSDEYSVSPSHATTAPTGMVIISLYLGYMVILEVCLVNGSSWRLSDRLNVHDAIGLHL